jgi:hypothetical protein
MKSSLAKKIFAVLAAASLTLFGLTPALATDLIKTNNFDGFAFEKSVVTPAMKSQIRAWVLANATAGYTMVSCTGYTGFNVNKRDQAFLQTLAETRSTNICDYIHTIKNVIEISATQGIPGDGKTASARKVTVRLIYPDGSNANTGGGSGGGTGGTVIGVCDNSFTVTMASRWASGDFYFKTITIKDISTTCRGKVLDVYLIDAGGSQMATSMANAITTTSLTLQYTAFSPTAIVSNQIKQVAFEVRAP